jgi:rod shape-determining protein MreD
MSDRLGYSFSGFLSGLVPFSMGLFAVVLANLPLSLLGGHVPSPLLALMPVYFWCLVRPDLMSPAAALVIGLLEDLLSGGPPGVWAVSFVACYALVNRQRDAFAGLSGLGAILGFAAAMLVTAGVAYLIIAIYFVRLPPATPLIVEIAVSVLFYIPGAVLLGWVHRHFVGPLRSDV